jgi:putative ATP-binding cassette transporter
MPSPFIKLASFFFEYSRTLIICSVIMGVVAGASSAALMILINARVIGAVGANYRTVVAFAAFAALSLATTTVSGLLSTRLAHRTSLHLRLHLCRRILATPLRRMEEVGSHRILTTLTQDIAVIVNALLRMPLLCINVAIVSGGLLYLGWLSPRLLGVLVVFVIISVVSYVIPQQRANHHINLSRDEFGRLFGHFRSLVSGAKELKLHRARRGAFIDEVVEPSAQEVRRHSLAGEGLYVLLNGWSQVLYFIVIGLILFAVPIFVTDISLQTLTGYALTVLYISGPLQLLVSIIPSFGQATVSLKKIEELGVSLTDSDAHDGAPSPEGAGWSRLELREVTHSYYREREAAAFTLGPVSLSFEPGELVFLIGGNGSGKTTFAKLLCGLYIPEGGEIRLDGVPIDESNVDDYRQYFSVVFTEFHLFEQLLGLPDSGLDDVAREYLKRLHLDHKVEVKDGKLSTTELSYGQRKRLALLTAFLEDRPIYVFDEWAADQDPIFKDIFYNSILPELRGRGKQVIVITHDDRYFHLADRIIKLDYGQVVEDRRVPAAEPAAGAYAAADGARARLAPGFDTPELERKSPARATVGFAEWQRLRAAELNGNGRPHAPGGGDRAGAGARADEGRQERGGQALFGSPALGSLLTALFVLAALLLAAGGQRLPAAAGGGAPAAAFSAERAMQHLKVIAARPHPSGSAAQAEVRDYLVKTLRDAGLEPEVQESFVVTQQRRTHVLANAQNVVARLRGTGPSGRKALLLAAHYDSVANSPGASDDGAGVVTLLETLRALKSGPPLQNDVVFLFTDVEEHGLLGARAFTDEHPWAKEVGLVLNFEARGSRGPVFMFETSEQNGRLIEGLGDAAPHPFASSMMYTFYRLMRNETDLNVFKGAGLAGMNFANIGGPSQYHSANDTLQALDGRSVQHHGTYALSLTRHFGDTPLDDPRAPDAVYFDLLGATLISYPQTWAAPLAVLLALLFAAAFYAGRRKGALTLRGTALGSVVLVLGALVSTAAVSLAWWGVTSLHPDFTPFSNAGLFLIGFAGLTLAATLSLVLLSNRWVSWHDLFAGALCVWLVGAVVTGLWLPGVSYLFAWPLLFGLGALAASCFAAGRGGRQGALLALLCACTLPGIVLVVSAFGAIFSGLALAAPFVLVTLEVLLLGLLLPHVRNMAATYRWLLVVASAFLGILFLVIGNTTPAYDESNPRTDTLIYNFDVDKGETKWVSYDGGLDEWTSQFFPASVVQGSQASAASGAGPQRLETHAPALALPKDDCALLEDKIVDGVRTVRMRVGSPRRPRLLNMFVEPGTEVSAATINGRRYVYEPSPPGRPAGWGFSYVNPSPDGLEVVLETRSPGPLKMTLASYTDGLPSVPNMEIRPRPRNLVPAINSDLLRVYQSFEFAPPAGAAR